MTSALARIRQPDGAMSRERLLTGPRLASIGRIRLELSHLLYASFFTPAQRSPDALLRFSPVFRLGKPYVGRKASSSSNVRSRAQSVT
jgi:hypothetical protein